jgi:hypothetical protein
MFYKIDPKVREIPFDLGADGFQTGDRLWVWLKGDFQPTPSGSSATDSFKNTEFRTGSRTFDAAVPVTVKARDTTLVAVNRDDPLNDNSDPDNDYGVEVKLQVFSAGDDFFSFRRDALPDVKGSKYKSGAGDDVVVMPHEPVAGFNLGRTFQTGAGDDKIRAGDLGFEANFGSGVDTLVLKDAEINWGNRENRDKDSKLVLTSGGERYVVQNAEILKDGNRTDPLVKWYFQINPKQDGAAVLKFFENGELIAKAAGFYDEALPIPKGKYEASFRKDGKLGERIELIDVSGYDKVFIKKGGLGNTETDFIAPKDFLKSVFGAIEDAYDLAGSAVPWKKGGFKPVVPVTADVAKQADQPFVKARNVVTDDQNDNSVAISFKLKNAGDTPVMEYKSVQIFFTMGGDAEKGADWDFSDGTRKYNGRNDFADGIVRHGRDGDGDMVYSVMLERGERKAEIPIDIFADGVAESNEKIRLKVVDIDLWKHKGSGPELYRLSGGPKADQERDFDGPTGAEALLLPDPTALVVIQDDLIT